MFPNLSRSAFAVLVATATLTACTPNPNGMGVADFGTVTGRVVDQQSLMPIAGATISIGNIVSITVVSDQGGFILRNVPVGTQMLTIRAIGWKPYTAAVTVAKDQATDLSTIGLSSSL